MRRFPEPAQGASIGAQKRQAQIHKGLGPVYLITGCKVDMDTDKNRRMGLRL